MEVYVYFILGTILGICMAVYFYEGSIEKAYYNNARFLSQRLQKALNNSSQIIYKRICEQKRELTEEEKDAIIQQCYKVETEK